MIWLWSFSNVMYDVMMRIDNGLALRYMNGFDYDLDCVLIPKHLDYVGYLKIKKVKIN